MEAINRYHSIVKAILIAYQNTEIANAPELDYQLIVNEAQTKFVLLVFGWQEEVYHHALAFHIEIRAEQIWIHQNNTDFELVERLVEEGVPEHHIVLGFVEEILRPQVVVFAY